MGLVAIDEAKRVDLINDVESLRYVEPDDLQPR